MRILIVTQVVDRNDPVLGFFHGWIEAIARRAELVHVICLKKGDYAFPAHVQVHSLGKEQGASRFKKSIRLLSLSWSLRHEYDVVFAHMNPEYVMVGGLLWKLLRKEIGLWYAHGAVTRHLRIAEKLTRHIFTSTPHGCRIISSKIHIVGQGIDTEHFSPGVQEEADDAVCRAVTVSRISRSKNQLFLIRVFEQLAKKRRRATLTIVGVPLTADDELYAQELREYVAEKCLSDIVTFTGGVTQQALPQILNAHTFFINAYKNHSLDKALLEAMACGLPTISSNASYRDLMNLEFGEESWSRARCPEEDQYDSFVESVDALLQLSVKERGEEGARLRTYVVANHGLTKLFDTIMGFYTQQV